MGTGVTATRRCDGVSHALQHCLEAADSDSPRSDPGSKLSDEQTDCPQQRNSAWLPPPERPERMHRRQEIPQNCAQTFRGENFGTKTEKRNLLHEIVPLRDPPPPVPEGRPACVPNAVAARHDCRHYAPPHPTLHALLDLTTAPAHDWPRPGHEVWVRDTRRGREGDGPGPETGRGWVGTTLSGNPRSWGGHNALTCGQPTWGGRGGGGVGATSLAAKQRPVHT